MIAGPPRRSSPWRGQEEAGPAGLPGMPPPRSAGAILPSMGPRHPAVTKATGADGFVYDGQPSSGRAAGRRCDQKDRFTYDGYSNPTNIRRTIGAANRRTAPSRHTATNRLTIGSYDHAGNQTALTPRSRPTRPTPRPARPDAGRSVTGSRSFVYLTTPTGRVAVDET